MDKSEGRPATGVPIYRQRGDPLHLCADGFHALRGAKDEAPDRNRYEIDTACCALAFGFAFPSFENCEGWGNLGGFGGNAALIG